MKKDRRWPVPGDSPLDQARSVARDYRNALHAVDPAACAALDQRALDVGQPWILPVQGPIDLNAMCTAPALAEHFAGAVRAEQIRQWAARGHIPRHTTDDNRTVYRLGDVLDHIAAQRQRRAQRHRSA
jgi:hypothetical protein